MANIVPSPADNDVTDAKLGSCQASTTGDIIERGRAILARLESNLRWDPDWCALILALGAGRDIALRTAGTDKPQGPKYRAAIGPWLRVYGFDRIDEADRSRLIECFDHLDEINVWWAALSAEKQEKVNHPRTVLAHWKRSLQPAPSDDDQKPPPDPLDPPAPPITIDRVLTRLTTATQEDKRLVAAALAADAQAMRKLLPSKQVPAKADDQDLFKKAMGLMGFDTTDGALAN